MKRNTKTNFASQFSANKTNTYLGRYRLTYETLGGIVYAMYTNDAIYYDALCCQEYREELTIKELSSYRTMIKRSHNNYN